jgi:hypothetical protein
MKNRNWKKEADLFREFGLVNSTIPKIWGEKKKRCRKPGGSDVSEARIK